MCGIVAINDCESVVSRLLTGLGRLEYRGYDSSGVATICDGSIAVRRATGKLENLKALLERSPLPGNVGIAHTRWATHGEITESNAHPHSAELVSIVHNGIVENHALLREELCAAGVAFKSQTDSEVIAHLIDAELRRGRRPLDAVHRATKELQGTYAIAAIFPQHPGVLVVARRGSPLAIAREGERAFAGSDAHALADLVSEVTYLEDGDAALLTATATEVWDTEGSRVLRPSVPIRRAAKADKGQHPHFMVKEIYEQVETLDATLNAFLGADGHVSLPRSRAELAKIKRVRFVACGTSLHAGMVARNWVESIARIPVEVEIASEFRYRTQLADRGVLSVFISQSGETADTLAALRAVKAAGGAVVGLVNVPESSIAREAAWLLPTEAGPEIGVASTKAFTAQLMALACLAVALGRARGQIDDARELSLVEELKTAGGQVARLLERGGRVEAWANQLLNAKDVLIVGRGASHALALEGALKIKETSYCHAEGFAAGELKHGSLALVEAGTPVVVLAPGGELQKKTLSNAQEILTRGGKLFVVGNVPAGDLPAQGIERLSMPPVSDLTAPMVYAVPLQLLAYHVASGLGRDVDHPRNLAKSVTVE